MTRAPTRPCNGFVRLAYAAYALAAAALLKLARLALADRPSTHPRRCLRSRAALTPGLACGAESPRLFFEQAHG